MRAKTFGLAALAAALVAASVAASPAQAAPKKRAIETTRHVTETRVKTRVRVERRSFLDAGNEVLPGQRKFTDYAFPPGYSPTAVVDYHGGIHPGPLPRPFDVPGHYPGNIGFWQF